MADSDLDEELRAAVEDNLRSGSMRLIIAVDEITDELKQIVSYLNFHTTDINFLAFEMRRAVGEGVEVLLPETYGEESAREKERSGPRRQRLDRETLLAGIREQIELAAHAAEGILDWADGEPRLSVRYTPAAGVRFLTAGTPLLLIDRRGQLGLILRTLSEHAEPREDENVDQLLRDLANLGIPLDAKRARPRAPLDPLADDATRTEFFALMDRVLDTLTSSRERDDAFANTAAPPNSDAVDAWSRPPRTP